MDKELPKVDAAKTPEVIIDDLKNFALSEVLRKYGSGHGDGENPKEYHNLIHTDGVYGAARQIAELAADNGKIAPSDVVLVGLAATFHDIEQDMGGGANETESARIAEEKMRQAGIFSDEDIEKVKMMILGTVVYFEDGVMKQSATTDYLSLIVCDADLSSLGDELDIYNSTSTGLLYELTKTHEPTEEQTQGYLKNQLTLLTNHEFYTEEAALLYPHQESNRAYAEKLVA